MKGFDETVTEAVEKVIPSVVNISKVKLIRDAYLQVHPVPGVGSGFIINDEGYILTNAHVVFGSHEIKVALEDGGIFEAKIRGIDNITDLAIVKIEAKGLPVPKIAKNNNLKIGQDGNCDRKPFGSCRRSHGYGRSDKRIEPLHPDRSHIHGRIDSDRCSH